MTCVEQLARVCTVGTGYVDDVTLGTSIPVTQQQTETKVYYHIKRMGQLWERLLFITGGRLELSKCFWVSITWKWRNGTPYQAVKHKLHKQLILRESETKELIPIPRKTGRDSEKRLGVWSTCDGKWNTEVRVCLEHSKEFSRRVRGTRLSRTAGYLAYHSVWLAKFRYSASVVGYTLNLLKEIQRSVMGSCLTAAGYNSKMPRAVVFGPQTNGGMDWDNIVVLGIFEKIKLLIGSVRLHNKVGQMFLIQLSWLQLFAGISVPLLQSEREVPYLPLGWISNLHMLLVETGVQIEMSSGWLPTIQREDDRVVMDIVRHQLPEWTWEGINRCRLFLHINTVADMATLDGKFIPSAIREVKRKIRQNTLQFPIQRKPSEEDIHYWQHFVGSISTNGHLHVPLGSWCRSPDQRFQYLINEQKSVVYKRREFGWEMFGRHNVNTRRFKKIRLQVQSIPPKCTPVQVIASINYLIVTMDTAREPPGCYGLDIYKKRQKTAEVRVIGQYDMNAVLLQQLKQTWHGEDCKLVCATDGGLKDMVGTSSYAIFLPNEEQAVIAGRSGEYQPWKHASSTRQELLGQLGLEYWLQKLQEDWGVPRHKVTITLVTDSQASVEILVNAERTLGIKDMLKPEMDVALEILRLRRQHTWIYWDIQKVESHIEKQAAPDEFFWECNEYADQLATKAREELSLEDLKQREMYIFHGTKACCKINNRIENNALYMVLKERINGEVLHKYLLEKYHWSEAQLNDINWPAHNKELAKTPQLRKVTLFKYIHGWLSTNKRRYRELKSQTEQCPLCLEDETRGHYFVCGHPQMAAIRVTYWKELVKGLSKNTESGFKEIFIAGLSTIIGREGPTDRTKTGWHQQFIEAYEAQQDIGWEQVMYGRLSKKWEPLAQLETEGHTSQGGGQWTGRAVRLCWQFGLDLWTVRNKLVHGNIGGVSNQEQHRVKYLIELLYEELLPQIPQNKKVMFARSRAEMLLIPYQSQLVWLGKMKFLWPIQYREIEAQLARMVRAPEEIENQHTIRLEVHEL